MTEDLLAFVTVIAIWKIVQVWSLRSKVKRLEREKATVRGELDRLTKNLAAVHPEAVKAFGEAFGKTLANRMTDHWSTGLKQKEWPDEVE